MKIVKHPFFLLVLKTIGASFLILSVVSIVIIFIGILSSTAIMVFQELFPLDLDAVAKYLLGGFFIFIVLLMAYVLFLTPINVILGIVCGFIIATFVYLDFATNKINFIRSSIVSGLTIGLLGNLNFFILIFLIDPSYSKYSWDYTFSRYFPSMPPDLSDWSFYWGIILILLMISIGFYSGMQIVKILSKGLLTKDNAL